MTRYATKETASLDKSIFMVFLVLAIFTLSITVFSLSLLKELDNSVFQKHVYTNLSVDNLTLTGVEYNESNRSKLIEKISLINEEEKIKNEEIFGTSNSDYIVVIVIQVNIRIRHLQYLIRSLEEAHHIHKALLVFSHDFFDDNINRLVNSIKFCKFIQIFYPHSIQAYPDVFPGYDPKDCPTYTSKNETINRGCVNGLHSDNSSHENYRNPQLSQVKHHWWWKANRVFDLASLQSYNGLVLFLEDDNYVLEDFIHVLKLMEDITKYSCKHCKLLALASNIESEENYLSTVAMSLVAVTSRFSNYGIAFNRSVWRELSKCKYFFCTVDDYNWDFSLKNVFLNCIKSTRFLVLYAARVFHLGVYGLHFTTDNCNPTERLKDLEVFFRKGSRYLFPKQLHLIYNKLSKQRNITYGGWDDLRDHALCLGMTIR